MKAETQSSSLDAVLISGEQLDALFGIASATRYRWQETDPAFPKPVRFPGGRTVRWRLADVIAYIESLQAPDSLGLGSGGAQ